MAGRISPFWRISPHVSIRRLMRVTALPNALTLTENETVSHLKEAKLAHHASVKKNIALRESYLQSRDEARAEANGSTVEEANGSTVEIEWEKRRTTGSQRDAGRKIAKLKKLRVTPQ
jgi:hypothetical protein